LRETFHEEVQMPIKFDSEIYNDSNLEGMRPELETSPPLRKYSSYSEKLEGSLELRRRWKIAAM
jgi:hypothetical protein